MDDDTSYSSGFPGSESSLHSIGELARLTGLTVRTIRFWSDTGVVPPTDRTPAGYRLYGPDALARLGLVRTLRDLGVGLPVIRQVLEREITVAEVAAVHAEALDVQIRTLRLRQAVLRAVAGRGSTPEEMELMHKLATLSDQERRRLINEFIDSAFEGLDVDPDFLASMRSGMPELPENPSQEQLDAWVELAELVQDEGFRAGIRRAAEDQTRAWKESGRPDGERTKRAAQAIKEGTEAARRAGIAPDSPEARRYVDEMAAVCAEISDREDGPEFRAWLLERLETGNDPRYGKYWRLVAVINGWSLPDMEPATEWFTAAVRAAVRG
ncbi:MerR family transcriptional regulator [Streptomyces nondiastaticus]|uniref:MerR family transcriptional regulator n=1 Tax=Streptomyces TaxID=1883 RepID=UPI0026747260|nr:MerR family transcriptional regulator [Streptomyces sp. VNUA116]WKU45408.1 MerR family transcriptional regulator [Streptomyces sp. VNUA116]